MVIKSETLLDLPDKYYIAIGEVIYRWALLEFQMQAIIWRALDIDNKKGRTLTIGADSKALFGMLRTVNLRWAVNKTEIRMIKALVSDAQDIGDERHILAHGVWVYPQNGKQSNIHLTYMKSSSHRILPKTERLPLRRIKTVATKLRKINERAESLYQRIGARQKASS